MSFCIQSFGNPDSETVLLQMADDHDLELLEREVSRIQELTGEQAFCLKAFRVNSWNRDLSPWQAPAVFGKEDFGSGAAETLEYLLRETAGISRTKKVFLGGYSLAGLFALWAGCQTDRFDGIAAASPSVWFPGFLDYMKKQEIRARAVYLSLGDKEERTRNAVMAAVGDKIREAHDLLRSAGVDCTLEWNQGNHFRDPELRTAKAFAWLMKRTGGISHVSENEAF